MNCPRCGGRVMGDGRYEPSCIVCGWVYYADLALAESLPLTPEARRQYKNPELLVERKIRRNREWYWRRKAKR